MKRVDMEGRIHTEVKDSLKRVIRVPPGKRLEISFTAMDPDASVDDTVFVSEGAELLYRGKFKSESNDFKSAVHIIHKEPNAKSFVDVKGVVKSRAEIVTTGEVLPGSDGSEVSVNSTAVVFGDGRIRSVPKLLIRNPNTKSYHSFRKIRLSPEQIFYLGSRGFSESNIEKIYERLMLGD